MRPSSATALWRKPVRVLALCLGAVLMTPLAHAVAEELRWGPGEDQRAWVDPATVAVVGTGPTTHHNPAPTAAAQAPRSVHVMRLAPVGAVATKSASSTLPVLRDRPNGGQAMVAKGNVLVRCDDALTCEPVAVALEQLGWQVYRHAVRSTLVVVTPPGKSAIEAATSLSSMTGVRRADPDFWRPLQLR